MKNEYKVQYMTEEAYRNYMGGTMFVPINEVIITAETAEEAVAVVKTNYPNMVVNEHPRTLAEIEAEEKAWEAKCKEAEEKKARAKARREERDRENGITPEKRKAMNSLKRHEAEVRRIEAEIEALKAELETERKIVERKKVEIERM